MVLSSVSIVLSGLNSEKIKILNHFLLTICISTLFCLYITNTQVTKDIYPGQNEKYIKEITARVLGDSREIGGGKSIFSVNILSARNINSTITSASGELTIASTLNLYKGQVICIQKGNMFHRNNSLIFVDRKKIDVVNWEKSFNSKVLKIRAKIFDYLKLRINRMNYDTSLLFTALFTGVKENPRGRLFTSLRKAGASHILALSGMHLGIISFVVMYLLKLIVGKKISFIFTLIIVFLYVFIVSSGPSLHRALILFTLLGLFGIIGFRIDIFHLLIISFLIQVIIDPSSAYLLSFQLSYLALGGIILGSAVINQNLPGFIPPGVRGILSASISAQLFTAALVLHSFGVIYPVGIISGIILVPIITLFIWTGIIGIMPMPWVLQKLLFSFMDLLYLWVDFFAEKFSLFPALELNDAGIGTAIICFLFILARNYHTHPFIH